MLGQSKDQPHRGSSLWSLNLNDAFSCVFATSDSIDFCGEVTLEGDQNI